MFYSVFVLLNVLTQMTDTAHKLNIKCDIQYMYLEVEPVMSSSVQALHDSSTATFITMHSVTTYHQKSQPQYSLHTCAHINCRLFITGKSTSSRQFFFMEAYLLMKSQQKCHKTFSSQFPSDLYPTKSTIYKLENEV